MTPLLPQLKGGMAFVALDRLAAYWFTVDQYPLNPLLDPEICANFVNEFHRTIGFQYSVGGWMEDRSHIWRGHYMMKQTPPKNIHVGVDFNVPAGTEVHAPFDGKIIEVFDDMDQDGGWGTRIICQGEFLTYRLVLAHLERGHVRPGKITKGAILGRVGDSSCNGNWYPHLHAQCVVGDIELATLDGYYPDHPSLPEQFPDPLKVLGMSITPSTRDGACN